MVALHRQGRGSSESAALVKVEFTAYGTPAPQGSKNQFGGESNPRTRPWRAAVTAEAAQHFDKPLTGPVRVGVTFVFTRPRKHYRTGKHADELRGDAPLWMATTPDADKLCRAIGDALSGVAILDEKQIAWWDVMKHYGSQACAQIVIEALYTVEGEQTQIRPRIGAEA
jgi:Holliday junction resolvase RusA-like endonuclease